MSFSSNLKEELENQKVWDNKSSMPQDEQIARICIREAFLKSGFINEPTKEYHLEILLNTNKKAEELKRILDTFTIKSKNN